VINQEESNGQDMQHIYTAQWLSSLMEEISLNMRIIVKCQCNVRSH